MGDTCLEILRGAGLNVAEYLCAKNSGFLGSSTYSQVGAFLDSQNVHLPCFEAG